MTESERDRQYQARQKHTQPVKWTRLHSGRRHFGELLSRVSVHTTACRSKHHDMTAQRQRSSEGMQTERASMKRGWDKRGSGPASRKLNVNGWPVGLGMFKSHRQTSLKDRTETRQRQRGRKKGVPGRHGGTTHVGSVWGSLKVNWWCSACARHTETNFVSHGRTDGRRIKSVMDRTRFLFRKKDMIMYFGSPILRCRGKTQ